MAPVRYRPADILRWLEMGSETLRKAPIPTPKAGGDIGRTIFEVVGTLLREGKGTVATIAGKGLEKVEYRLFEDRLETGARTISYADISRVRATKSAGYTLEFDGGSLSIKPYAWLEVAGHRVPIGWQRDGMEVPFELLAEEVAARAKVSIERP
jgi:hypothetical protein